MTEPLNGVPRHQVRIFKCPECKDEVFQVMLGTVKFAFDALDPDKMQPVSTKLVKCMGCGGFLVKSKDGYRIVHKGVDEADEGEEWKESS